MSKPYEYPGGFLLTKKKAEALAVRELGTAKGLEQESGTFKGVFVMHLGNMTVQILPDVYTNRGKIAMEIEFSFSPGRIYRFFGPAHAGGGLRPGELVLQGGPPGGAEGLGG